MQASIPFASFVWTVNFQFSNRSIRTFVVKDLIVEESLYHRLSVTFLANGQS